MNHVVDIATAAPPPLLEVRELVVSYPAGGSAWGGARQRVRVVDRISLEVDAGEVLALVGESGCGKTSLARGICGLAAPDSGSVHLSGRSVTGFADRTTSRDRAAVQMVFQDPFESLNPRKSIGDTLSQPLRLNRVVPRRAVEEECVRLLLEVGLPADALRRYPHQFSGGQRQRIGIARAIATRPSVLIADEAVSALDISIRSQLLRLLAALREKYGLAILFITHDLAVVRSFADRVAVMYLGQIVEEGTTEAVFGEPAHPYTQALLRATPIPDPVLARAVPAVAVAGDVPAAGAAPSGCRFHPRCPVAIAQCRTVVPERRLSAGGSFASCHLITVPA